MSFFDYIVIGAGINGTWAAAHLGKRGHSVVLLEKFPLPHSRGSSHGASRIIRKVYPQPFFNDMMGPAYKQWHELEQECGETFITSNGLLVFGTETGDTLKGMINTFENSKNPDKCQVMSNDALKRFFPMVNFESSEFGILDEEAGSIKADKSLKASRDHAERHGVQIVDNYSVDGIVNQSGLVRVQGGSALERREFVGRGLVICPGPWASDLLNILKFPLPLEAQRVPVYYFKYSNFLPCVFIYDSEGNYFYGIPENEYPGLLKLGSHEGIPTLADSRDDVDCSEIKKKVIEFIKRTFPGVDPNPAVEEVCMYTVTPDWVPIITRHPCHSNIVIGCGFSGTGFKLGPVTGEILADMVTGKTPKFDLEPFRHDRFGSAGQTDKFFQDRKSVV